MTFTEKHAINHILVLCLGNICRSPIAEALLKKKYPDKTISSAGTSGMTGWPADPSSIKVMFERGIDIRSHIARNLSGNMVHEADLILTMEEQQTKIVESRFPESRGKVMRLGEYGGFDIPDPYRKSIDYFQKTCELIELGIEQLIKNKLDPDES